MWQQMHICYIDEAGCTGDLPAKNSPIQPVLVVAGVAFDHACIRQLTYEYLALKKRFFPGSQINSGNPSVSHSPPNFLDWVLPEIKGATLRRNVATGNRNQRRHALLFLGRVLSLLAGHNARIMGRVLIKGIGTPIAGRAVYSSAIQTIFSTFDSFLAGINDRGFIVADSRTKGQNVIVAHSLFTQKFQAAGDAHPSVLEMPTFGHSDNHVGIQIADLLCSALLFPIAAQTYCSGHINNVHVQPGYASLKVRFGTQLAALQHRYQDAGGRWTGGIVVNDRLTRRSGAHLFV